MESEADPLVVCVTLKSLPEEVWARRVDALARSSREAFAAALGVVLDSYALPSVSGPSHRAATVAVLVLVACDIGTVADPARRNQLRDALRRTAAALNVPFPLVLEFTRHGTALEAALRDSTRRREGSEGNEWRS